jgi:hypothetical protein
MGRGQLRDLAFRPNLPKWTVRLRLTALYGALFLPLGVALVVITFVVTILSSRSVAHAPVTQIHGHGKTIVDPSGGA